jgi:L-iditol 2-dehydrogenase
MAFLGTPPVDGAFARRLVVHADFAVPLPDAIPDEVGALLEPLSVGLWACWRGGVRAGSTVLVTGAGPIGQLAMQAALACGATSVVVTDTHPARVDLALRTGATRGIHVTTEADWSRTLEADVLIECSGQPAALRDGIMALRPRGTAVVVGIPPSEEVPVPMTRIRHRELAITSTFRFAGTYAAAIELVAAGRVDPAAIAGGSFGLDETESALRAGRDDPTSVKVFVRPGE